MATAVQIELMVDEAGAIQGIRSFDTAVKGTTGSVRQLSNEMRIVGGTATTAGRQATAAVEKTGVASLNTLERTRMVTEEFGIRLPRAMVRLVAQSEIAQKAISAVGTGIIALGAVQVGVMIFDQMYEGAKKLWENYLSLNSAAEEYQRTLEKTKDEDYWKSDSIETTTLRINEATAAARNYRTAAESGNSAGWQRVLIGTAFGDPISLTKGVTQLMTAHAEAGASVKNQESVDKLTPQQAAQQHELAIQTIEYNHAADGKLQGRRKINAELAKRKELSAEARNYDNARNKALGNPVASDAGSQKQKLADRIADQQAATETFNLQREQTLELAHLREAALEAGLHGSALYAAQEAAAIADLKAKDMDSAAARNAIHLKFHNEEMKRLEDERTETQKIQMQAAMVGMTGVAKIRAQGDIDIGDVRGNQNLPDDEKDKRVQAIKDRTNAEILQSEQAFTERMNQPADEGASHQVSAFERVRLEAQRKIVAVEKDYRTQYGSDVNAPEYKAHLGELNRAEGGINAGAADQQAELTRRNSDETAQIEIEARARSMTAEKQQTLAVEAEYQQRLQKYQQQLRDKEISDDDYNRRVLSAAQIRDAEMVEASKQAREKMAGEFSHFFQNPMSALKEFGDKAAGEATAALVQRMQGRFPGVSGNTRTVGRGGMLGGIFDHLAGTHSPALALDHKAEMPGTPAAERGMISLGTAQIHVAAASIVLSGSAMPGGGYSGGTGILPSGGSTSMLTVPGSSFGSTGSSDSTAFGGGFGGGGFGGGGTGGGEMLPPAGGGKVSGAFANLSQATGLAKSGISMFHGFGHGGGSGIMPEVQHDPGAGTLNADGTFTSAGKNNGMLGGGGVGSNAMGAVGGAAGMYSAIQGNGGMGGALGGAMSGMQLGMALGGPMGAAVGAAAGAIVGAIGFGGREKARVYDLKQVRPRISNDIDGYQQGTMDYLSAYSDVEALSREANLTTNAMGPAGKHYYQDTIKNEIKQAYGKLTAEQRAGRSNYTAVAAQYDIGTDFVPRDGLAMIHQHERIIPSDQNERITRAVESGASLEAVHRSYQAAMSTRDARPQASGGERTMNMNVHAIDSKGVVQFFDKYKHHMRAALNSSKAENSGGADA